MGDALSRRRFLAAAAGGIGAVACAGPVSAMRRDRPLAWSPGKQVNPAIDNLRVVHCTDPAMIRADPTRWDVRSQNAPVVAERVRANVEAMACALAEKTSSAEAWAAIFRKPETKAWPEVKVAIKPNGSGGNMARVAVIDTVCSALAGLGVRPANIRMYGCPRWAEYEAGGYRPFLGNGLPTEIVLSHGHDAMGGTVEVETPGPDSETYQCAAALADGSIDILVNIATNKGHMLRTFGGISLTMKNHAGSFVMPLTRHAFGGLDYIIEFNRSDLVLGGTPPRQQLCIVDSLWGMTSGPGGVPNARPVSLSMGTFGPAVDWLVAKKVREPLMGCSHPDFLSDIVTGFGYEPPALAKLDFVRVEPA